MDKYVVIDLETTGHTAAKGDKIIEVGIVVVEQDNITKEYATFLNPGKKIPAFISNLTGIKDQDVIQAPSFVDEASHIVSYFDDAYLIAHNVPFDLGFLNQELKNIALPALQKPVLDTVELARILYPGASSYKLSELAALLGISHNRPHRAVSDAYVTAKIFLRLKEKLFSLPYETIEHLLRLERVFKSDLLELLRNSQHKSLFSNSVVNYDVYKGIAVKTTKVHDNENKEQTYSAGFLHFGELLDHLFEKNGALEYMMTNFEKRPGQREMSEMIFDAFQQCRHAMIEAGTGTGKSLAYLIPAVYEAVKNNKRVVISTYTTQLQTQLFETEIPFLKKLLPFSFTAALLKGRRHFINLDRFEEELLVNDHNYDVALSKAMIVVWLTETDTGDFDELHLPISGKYFANRISASSETQTELQLQPFNESLSFYQKAKMKAVRANIIITNHALLCTDIFHEYQLIPAYNNLIIDEAHHLEETASNRFGLKLDYVHVLYELNQIGRTSEDKWLASLLDEFDEIAELEAMRRWDAQFEEVKNGIDDLFRYIFQFILDQHQNTTSYSDIGRIQFRMDKMESTPTWYNAQEMVNRLKLRLDNLLDALQMANNVMEGKGTYNVARLQNSMESLKRFATELTKLFLVPEQGHVRWIEIESKGAKNAVYLYSEPSDISSFLTRDLFSAKKSVIMTSATLTMNHSFSFIKQRLGIPSDMVDTKIIHSPFSYKDQVQVLVPNDFPDVRGDQGDFTAAVCEAILSLSTVTQGRMLVLFTSYDMLKKTYYLLKDIVSEQSYMLIAQGITSGSRTRLKKNFQSFDKAILLGTNSFWEGVDIPGKDLSCLVIVRLPFEVPDHPIFAARSQKLQYAGRNAFFDLSLPNAVIRFKQGFGRLIRSQEDRGIVFVCDSRIIKAKYSKFFTNSITDVPLLYDSTAKLMEKARDWF